MPEYIYLKPVSYVVEAAETLREIGELPHMLLRIGLRGGHFPHRGTAAFARIEGQDTALEALTCEVDDDEGGLRAYFPTDTPLRGTLVVGYGTEVVAEFELDRLDLAPARLEEGRIVGPFHRVTRRDPGIFERQR